MNRFHLFLLVFLGLLVSGCAGLPPVVTYLGYAKTVADVGSFILTKKTITDNTISAIAEKDCVLSRVIVNEKVCRINEEQKEKDIVLAKNDLSSTVDFQISDRSFNEPFSTSDNINGEPRPNVVVDYSVLYNLHPNVTINLDVLNKV